MSGPLQHEFARPAPDAATPAISTETGASRIARAFDAARAEQRAALIAYLAAGDPDLSATPQLAAAVAAAGADIIELGIPFSDPLADGPVIQAAYARALAAGTNVKGVLDAVRQTCALTSTPVVLMTAYNPVLAYGVHRFCSHAAEAGAAGVLVADLLPDDADELRASADAAGLGLVFLAAPDSPDARLAAAAEASTGFLYLVARRGVTGRAGLAEDLEQVAARARAQLPRALAIGFGVATPEDVAKVARLADGVVVGSALVKVAAEASHTEDAAALVAQLVAHLRPSPHGPSSARANQP